MFIKFIKPLTLILKQKYMKNLQNLFNQKQTLENQLKDLNKQNLEAQAVDKFNINLEPIKELQNFQSNNSTLESIRDELLITLVDSDIDQFLITYEIYLFNNCSNRNLLFQAIA